MPYPTTDQMRTRARALVNKLAEDASHLRHVPVMKRDETLAFIDSVIARTLPGDDAGLATFAQQFVDTFVHLHDVRAELDVDTVAATVRAMLPGAA